MHILLLGKDGQLGKALRTHLEQRDIQHTAVGRDTCDVTNQEQLQGIVNSIQPTHIVNCTAYTNVDGAETEEGAKKAYEVNEKAVQSMVEAAANIQAYLLHISTDYVFDGSHNSPYVETDETNPLQVYGASKLAGEKHVLSYGKGLVLRTSWVYGKGEQNFIHKFLQFAATRDELSGTEDEVSIPTSTEWLSRIILASAEKNLTGLFHAVPHGQTSRLQWAQTICDIWNLKKNLSPATLASWNLPAQRPHYSVMSAQNLEHALGQKFPDWQELLQQFYSSL